VVLTLIYIPLLKERGNQGYEGYKHIAPPEQKTLKQIAPPEQEPLNKSLLRSKNPSNKSLRGKLIRLLPWLYVFLEKFDDVFGGGAGEEDFGDALLLEFWEVFLRDDAAYEDQNVVHSFFTQ
jgi:hypothetical protein